MRAELEAGGAVARNIDLIFDREFGIVGEVAEVRDDPAAPDFIHYAATTCDPSALGGAGGRFTATAAATDRDTASSSAVCRAIARYAAALYDRDALPLAGASEAGFRCVPPGDFALYSEAQYTAPGFPFVRFDQATPVRWAAAIDLAAGDTVHMPAAFVWLPYPWLRQGGDLPIVKPTTTGLACADSITAATLAGLQDVVVCDALALFWQTATAPPQVRKGGLAEPLRDLIGRFEATGDRVAILDITTNNRIPSFAAVSTQAARERPAFAFGAAADLDPEVAIEAALVDLARSCRLAGAAMRHRPPPSPVNDWEDANDWQDNLAFAADRGNAAAIEFALSSEDRRDIVDYDRSGVGSVDSELETVVARVLATGCRAYAANLTSEDVGALGLSVVRAVVPGYQLLFPGHRVRPLGGSRIYDVPQKLGYRGIFRGSGGNPFPHPFARES